MKKNLEHIGEYDGYQVYRNSDGFLEGYKKIGKRIENGQDVGKDLRRLVTRAKTMQGFINHALGMKLKPAKPKKVEMPKLFE